MKYLKKINDYFTLTSDGLFTAFINPIWASAFPDTAELDRYFYLRYGERIANKLLLNFTVDGAITTSTLAELAKMVYDINAKKWEHYFKVYEAEYNPIENTAFEEKIHDVSSGQNSGTSSSSGTSSNTTSGNTNVFGFNSSSAVGDTTSGGSGSGSSTATTNSSGNNSAIYDRTYSKHGNIGVTENTTMIEHEVECWGKWSFIYQICKDICNLIALSVY